MIFNTRNNMTMGQLAGLYGNDPDNADQNLFTGSSQGYGYVQDQARAMGIDDPRAYFNAQLAQRQLANTPSGAQMEAARQMGQYSPQSLPGQLQARDSMWDAVSAAKQTDANGLASLQQQQNFQNYPLPQPGQQPSLSPVMMEDMKNQGISDPMQYILSKRLGTNRTAVQGFQGQFQSPRQQVSLPEMQGGQINPDDLLTSPSFQSRMQANPQSASGIFGAVTGQSPAPYATQYAQGKQDEHKYGVDTLRKALSNQDATIDKDGNISWRQVTNDPLTGKPVMTNNYGTGNAYQKAMEKYLPYVESDMGKMKQLAAEKAASLAKFASMQNGAPIRSAANNPADSIYASSQPDGGTASQTLAGSFNDIGNILTGQSQAFAGGNQAQGFDAPTGQAVRHARPLLAHNPQFQQLLRTNPDAARRLILSIQMGQ